MSGSIPCHPAFRLLNEQKVPSLKITIYEYQHGATGAQHIHLASESNENVFLVALRTVPEDSSGVAHILEHTALCGSKTYPVRDPFFMMTRRSINTFMNAFTSSDWTAYPFASQNRKDYFNLLDVYLDAVFFSRLDPLDFAQEGHRLEFSEMENTQSELLYKGVVYNEMKGAMSSVNSQLWHTLSKYLFPTNTYHHNSGGEPDCIPDLTYAQLLQFYKTHYHPSNASFMTFGDIPPVELQTLFEDRALKHFDKLDHTIKVEEVKRYYGPVRVQESYPCNDDDISQKSHVVVSWLLGKSTELEDSLRAQLLSSVLLDHSATPLMHALETTDLGSSPSPLCGLDDSQLELSFICGLEGCAQDSADDVEKHIVECLEKVAQEGIPREDLESALHQLELNQREPGGDSYPYGLQMILTALNATTHRGDPVALLNIDESLEKLRKEIANPNFVKDLIKSLLLDNPHRVRLHLNPDKTINARKEAAEKIRLQKIASTLNEAEKKKIVAQSLALQARQNQQDDASILPKVTLDDVPKTEVPLEFTEEKKSGQTLSFFSTGTNGLVYQQVIYQLPELGENALPCLPLYSTIIPELGVGSKDYLEIQRQQASVTGGINAFSSVRTAVDNKHEVSGSFIFSSKALNRNQKVMSELLRATIQDVRFDESARMKELIAQIRAGKEQSITGSGHALAMLAASAGICASAKLSHELTGLHSIKFIKELDKSLGNKNKLEEFAATLGNIHQSVTGNPSTLLLIAEEENKNTFSRNMIDLFSQKHQGTSQFILAQAEEKLSQAWLCNSQVNFCAKAYPTVTLAHEDSAPLVVLGNLLRNVYLHKSIREQGGAYGGGASQDSSIGAFRFYSYRDPRLEETLSDFDLSIQRFIADDIHWEKYEEAILGTISSLDKSESPAGRAKREYHANLHGRTVAIRQTFRERVLACQKEDLKRVAEKYLQPEMANTAVISDFSKKSLVEDLGLSAIEV